MNPTPKIKIKLSAFARKYLATLRKHLKKEAATTEEVSHKLGLQAMKLGLETLDLARIHEEAMTTLVTPPLSSLIRNEIIQKAGVFFAEVASPIEQTHRGAQEANVHLRFMIETLSQRTVELAASNEELKQEVLQRKAAELSLRTSETNTSNLLIKSHAMQKELRMLSRRLLSAQEEERKSISRELHDVISQTLTGINVRLASLKKRCTNGTKELYKTITITQQLVEKSVDIVHRFARDLRPTVLDDLGLVPALQAYMKSFMEETGVRVKFTADAQVEKLNSIGRTVLYRIAQESLTNIARHAKASSANVVISRHNGALLMEIYDDGQGFQMDEDGEGNRLGLLGMRERAEMIGGTFKVNSAPGKGSTIQVEIPKTCIKEAKRQVKIPGKTKPKPKQS